MAHWSDIPVRIPHACGFFAALLFASVVCVGPLQAQMINGNAARVIELSGQVSVLRGSATWALNVGDSIEPQQIVVTGPDGSATFQVADGSKFQVFKNSKAIFRNTPGDWRDFVDMVIGRVRVEIEKLGGQPNRNKVRTATAVISVRGTIFDVEVEDIDGTTMVLVEEGRVEVQHLLQPGSRMLNPGEWVEVFPNQPLAFHKADHGAILQQIAKAANNALYEILMRRTNTGTGTAGGATSTSSSPADCNKCNTGGTSTGTGTTPTPPPAPPPPPAAPPPPPH